ncbi:MAG: hypothetical protein ACYDAY_01845 [Candidatus Dormibacteria bacterium]
MLIRLLRLFAEPSHRQAQIDIIRDSVIPESRTQRGWMGALLLTQPDGGLALSASFWANVEAIEESEAGGHYRAQLDKFHGVWVQPPDRDVLNVAVHHFADLEGARAARVTTLPIRLGTERDVEHIFRDSVVPELTGEPGFCGTMLLPRPVKSVAITMFGDLLSLARTEQSGFYQEQVGKMEPFLSGDSIKEIFEVTILELKTPAKTV